MSDGVFLFVCIALFSACIGAATGLLLADFIAAASIVWAWVIHEQGGGEDE